ncbi:MAG: hypothetical protein EPO36_11820 [Chloroflexota bacterium]|nr:MAG: hypothetical protein EPO36_11820 [Chloroflexota bacterium]
MAIIGPIFALVGRLAGRLLNSALGWATILLFGKVQGRKQTIMLLIALGSLLWVATLVGALVPDAGTFLLALVPRPDFIPEFAVRLAMLALAVVIPLLIGIAAVVVTEPASRPRGVGLVGAVIRGYPFTLVLAVTIAVLLLVSVQRWVRSLWKRWDVAHVPVIVKPGGYDAVVRDLADVLAGAGIPVRSRPAPVVLSVPPRLLDAVAGKALGGLVPDRLLRLVGTDLEVLVYPSDVAISGSRRALARSRAAIASKLTASPVYLTTSAEAQRVEDAIRRLADDPSAGIGRLPDLDARIAALEVPFDEWETVYRERLRLESQLARRGGSASGAGPPGSVARRSTRSDGRRDAPVPLVAAGWVGLGLIVLDLAFVLAERVLPSGRARTRARSGRGGRWWR